MRKYSIFSGVISLLLILALMVSGCSSDSKLHSETKAEESPSGASQPFDSESPEVSENRFPVRKGLETVLFMGLDKYEAPVNEMGYLNDQQCDFLLLFVIDEKQQVCDVIHLNRDTMTEIRRLGVGGRESGKFIGQLCLSHTYGSGGSDSCLNTTKAVSKLLKGVPIDHYVAMTMEGVGALNDIVGGVTVTVPDDMSKVDSELRAGAEVTLHGEQALVFVRSRMDVGDGSNLSRMERQRIYLKALYEKLLDCVRNDEGFVDSSLLKMTAYFQSDLPLNSLDDLCMRLADCTINPFTVIEGEANYDNEFVEFYINEDSLDQVLNDIFAE